MKKQTKMNYESPIISEIDLRLKDFIADARASELKDFNRVEGSLDLSDYDEDWNNN